MRAQVNVLFFFSILSELLWGQTIKVNSAVEIEEALLKAASGDVIQIAPGVYKLATGLSLKADRVTLRGAGIQKTILSFDRKNDPAVGLEVIANRIQLEDFTLRNSQGNALVVRKSNGTIIRRIRAEWTGSVNDKNGGYGIYPVESENVLIEDCEAYGASDAGIYLGQSEKAILRRNRSSNNVFGIEVENSDHVDVLENIATNNAVGIGALTLPNLNKKDSHFVRLMDNVVLSNNTSNFAPLGSVASNTPTGTGILLMAVKDVEVFHNTAVDNMTSNITIGTYYLTGVQKWEDKAFDPFSEAVYVHENEVWGGGRKPTGGNDPATLKVIAALKLKLGLQWPDILWDGLVDVTRYKGKVPEDRRICITKNHGARPPSFANFKIDQLDSLFKPVSRNPKEVDCTLPTFAGVSLK